MKSFCECGRRAVFHSPKRGGKSSKPVVQDRQHPMCSRCFRNARSSEISALQRYRDRRPRRMSALPWSPPVDLDTQHLRALRGALEVLDQWFPEVQQVAQTG